MFRRFLLAPDKFKGTIEAARVCEILSDVIRRHVPDAKIHSQPMSDGGEGMTRAYLSVLGGRLVYKTVTGPQGTPVEAEYAILSDGTAVMEMSTAAGLWRVEGSNDPLYATTRGVGELIAEIASSGVRKLLLGLGGSATNDCGIGMASALGWKFMDADGEEVAPVAASLYKISSIGPPKEVLSLSVTAACDVDNPLCGVRGATRIFGPQKGADAKTVDFLEQSMQHFASVLERDVKPNVALLAGAGAAGGMGAGVSAFLDGSLQSGIEMLLDAVGIDALLSETDLVITGEGRMDAQSAYGKVPAGVANRAKLAGVPCIALCGALGNGAEALYDHGVTAMFSTVHGAATMEQISKTCEKDLESLAENVMRILLMKQ